MKALHERIDFVPGFGPSVPQQLKDGHLFRGEVSPNEVDSVFGKVRGDYRTQKFRTSTAFYHLRTHSEESDQLNINVFNNLKKRHDLLFAY